MRRDTRKVQRQMEAEWEAGREVHLRAREEGAGRGASPARAWLDVQPLNRQSVAVAEACLGSCALAARGRPPR